MDISFREINLDDANFILEIENNNDIWKVSHTKENFTIKDIELFIANNMLEGLLTSQKRWIITKNNISCGCIDLFDYSEVNKRAGIGIIIHPNYYNNRIATVALNSFIKYCKNTIGLHQLYCTILEENKYSLQLFKNNNFEETGKRKDWTFYNGKFYDEIFFQLILK